MGSSRYCAWGYCPETEQQAIRPKWRSDSASVILQPMASHSGGPAVSPAVGGVVKKKSESLLPFGNGRSYGDSCLNSAGYLLDAGSLDRFIQFDDTSGILTCEAGITLSSILSLIVPRGWFLPVSPGTAYVTLGGAVANDVHGKNHHCDGTFGRFIKSFELVRSSGEHLSCSASENAELFSASIGGLGLTGFITRVSLQLLPIRSSEMDVRIDAFQGLQSFAQLSAARKSEYQYTVAWLDCAAKGARFGRGVFLSANHSATGNLKAATHISNKTSKLSVPFAMPSWLLNAYSVRAFNSLYYFKLSRQHEKQIRQGYRAYFYPLDSLGNWNRIYGSRGFYQYQFVVPLACMSELETMLRKIVDSGLGSFLAVLKEFGNIESPGMLSFPREGYCLALDFANRGVKTEQLIQSLDEQVMACAGAAYPAKDRLMSAQAFAQYFPKMRDFETHIDPQFTSDFWERVRG